ncbi:molybdenum cofactor guanylyltransferase [Clostridium sp. DSM 100503]|uniref:molybdenum cofactor guanylyltransferase n=1 Tax=Clostridium sp. DSM 100503 TaxID=2963282 RepID=UPI002149C1D5|nr:molybdenum cofactor guanylyltransferase [Clostridium sp. DSM 100503]MCR1949645.1 molybdenum cofactor guanylyltransferase [Clostridium sp. DSM 100503]
MINKTLAILAGGKSSRMNYNNKALLLYKEKTFIENIISAGEDFDEIIIISNNKEVYNKFSLNVFSDIYLGNGPLCGIHSALKNSKNDKVLCIACDMPLITKETLNLIGNVDEEYEVLIPKINEKLQPLCSVYSKRLIPKIENALIKNENKLQKFIMSTKYKVLEDKKYEKLNEIDFSNINTVNDYKDLEEI